MSKELEALQKLRDLVEYITRVDYVPANLRSNVKELLIKSYEESDGYFSQLEAALNELECANHNYKALKEFYNNAVAYGAKIQKELNELKKRNEPMKVDLKTRYTLPYSGTYYKCPKCNQYNPVNAKYCMECSQALEKIYGSDEK